MVEELTAAPTKSRGAAPKALMDLPTSAAKRIHELEESAEARVMAGLVEFDRVLGGGCVPGSVILVGVKRH